MIHINIAEMEAKAYTEIALGAECFKVVQGYGVETVDELLKPFSENINDAIIWAMGRIQGEGKAIPAGFGKALRTHIEINRTSASQ